MGRLFIVGIGPGSAEYMTGQARAAIDSAEVVCGYTGYIDLVRASWPDKRYIATPMRQELDRCRAALEIAQNGGAVAMICSGDAGVYGMAAPIFELSGGYPDAEIEIVPGITAALSGSAVLGAPLGHDFCVISLSDLLTPWEVIEKRLKAAAMGDFVTVLYNPGSKKRTDCLRLACEAMLQNGKRPDTVCGAVRNIGRAGQESSIMTLDELKHYKADMFTTIFVGNASTFAENGRIITPRGYKR